MNQSQAKAELVTLLSDTLSQVSDDRLNLAITNAWRDGNVATQAYDDSLVFDSSTYQYTIPSTVTTVDSIYVKYTSSDNPEPLSAELYEIINGNIHFNNRAKDYLSTGDDLHIRGKLKLSASDSIPADNYTLQNYVVNLAASIVLKQVSFSKALSFLKNDTSMSELIGFRQSIDRDVAKYRAQLQTSYVDN